MKTEKRERERREVKREKRERKIQSKQEYTYRKFNLLLLIYIHLSKLS